MDRKIDSKRERERYNDGHKRYTDGYTKNKYRQIEIDIEISRMRF